MTDLEYCEQLEAHMDNGGLFSRVNVRDLLKMVRARDKKIEQLRKGLRGFDRACEWARGILAEKELT